MKAYNSTQEKKINDVVFVLCSPQNSRFMTFWIRGTICSFSSNGKNAGVIVENDDRDLIYLPLDQIFKLTIS